MLVGRSFVVHHGDNSNRRRARQRLSTGRGFSPLACCSHGKRPITGFTKEMLSRIWLVDDIAIVVSGYFLTLLRNLVESALKITQR
jgi:hypothetical protein